MFGADEQLEDSIWTNGFRELIQTFSSRDHKNTQQLVTEPFSNQESNLIDQRSNLLDRNSTPTLMSASMQNNLQHRNSTSILNNLLHRNSTPIQHSTTLSKDNTITLSKDNTIALSKDEKEMVVVFEKYKVIGELGSGATAKVVLCHDVSDRLKLYALKICNSLKLKKMKSYKVSSGKMTTFTGLDNLEEEIAIMKKLHHPNVLRLVEVLGDDEKIVLVLEYVEYGQIMEYNRELKVYQAGNYVPSGYLHHGITQQRTMSEDLARHYFKQLLQGIHYMHQHRVCHRYLLSM